MLHDCLWDDAYKRTLAANREKVVQVTAAGFLSRYLNGPLPGPALGGAGPNREIFIGPGSQSTCTKVCRIGSNQYYYYYYYQYYYYYYYYYYYQYYYYYYYYYYQYYYYYYYYYYYQYYYYYYYYYYSGPIALRPALNFTICLAPYNNK